MNQHTSAPIRQRTSISETTKAGFLRPADLYYADLTEEETTCSGFFCESCIERFGKKHGHRPTLAAFLEAKATGQAAGLGKKLYETLVN